MMATTMKGLLKGLRYISQIFDSDPKEQEMQIGFPTDVKHVAHIGWDGPSVASPSWMNEFRSAPLSSTAGREDLNHSGGNSASRGGTDLALPKPSKASAAGTTPDSPKREPRRRNKSAGAVPIDSSNGEPAETSRHRRTKGGGSGSSANGDGCDSPRRDLPAIPKQARRKKTKGGGSGGSSKSSKSKAAADEDRGGEQVEASKSAAMEDERQ